MRVSDPRAEFQHLVSELVDADLKTMSMEELVGRLRVAEERCGGGEVAADSAGLLLLTEEQWEARRRERRGKEHAHSRSTRHGDGDRKGGRSGGHEDADEEPALL